MLWNFYFIPGMARPGYRLVYWDKFGQTTNPPLHRAIWLDAWWWDSEKARNVELRISTLEAEETRIMGRYLLKRLLLIVPTLFGIMVVNFTIVQFAPGGPIEQIAAELSGFSGGTTDRVSGTDTAAQISSRDAGAFSGTTGLDPALLADLEKQFGFDKPTHERFFLMLWNYIRLDFGDSYYQDRPVVDLVIERMPVSISLGLWSLILIYLHLNSTRHCQSHTRR